MEDKILFSTIGTSDPTRGEHDGPFLHIVRKYKPKKAFIFLTKEMCERDKEDNRYELAAQKVCPEIEIIKLRHPKIDNPQEFLIFDSLFEDYLNEISNDYPDCEIIINISSGTPQMLCSLYNIVAHADRAYKLIQVKSHENRANRSERVDTIYDLEKEMCNSYDNNLDESDGIENRCKEIYPINVRKKLVEKIIMEQISVYDYEGASLAAEQGKYLIDEEVIKLIENLKNRYNLQLNKCDKNILCIQDNENRLQSIFEYILYLDIKQKRNEMLDFTRGVSPVLTDLFEECLNSIYDDVNISQYCEKKEKIIDGETVEIVHLMRDKLSDEIKEFYDKHFNTKYRSSPLSSNNLLIYIKYKYQDNNINDKNSETLYKNAKLLRNFEMNFRNVAAHEIISVSDDDIKARLGVSSKEIVDKLKELFEMAYGNDYKDKIDWNSYDNNNKKIQELLSINKN